MEANDAQGILLEVAEVLTNKGLERDKPTGERSMLSTVNAFNALTKNNLSEIDGWVFMLCLKLARANGGSFCEDDYVDLVGYAALTAESAVALNSNTANTTTNR